MNIKQIRQAAKKQNIQTSGMKKTDIIRAIQRAEQTYDCFATDRIDSCNENNCLWRKDCIAANKNSALLG